jgi:hypothetical protein
LAGRDTGSEDKGKPLEISSMDELIANVSFFSSSVSIKTIAQRDVF